MDTLLEYADEHVFDKFYPWFHSSLSKFTHYINVTGIDLSSPATWTRDNHLRMNLSLFLIVLVGGYAFYYMAATLSYYFVFDHELMKHPRFLKNQIRLEIECASFAIPFFSLLTVPWFFGEVKGWSLLYEGTPKTALGWLYIALSVPLFLLFTDMGIYWIHRLEHHPLTYKKLHKLHHKWIVPTPFASHAFHPLDGYLQSIPYHLYVYMVPMHKWLYIFMFVFVNFWTVMIHDGNFVSRSTVINTTAHHTVHHLYFNYNYGQYFTFWDKLGGSHKEPTDEQYDAERRNNPKVWAQQAKKSDQIDADQTDASNKRKPKIQ